MISIRRARLAGAFSVTGSGDLVGRLLLFATVIVAGRMLAPEEFGRYVVIWAAAVSVAGLWDLGLSPLVTREIASGRVGLVAALRRALALRLKTAWLWLLATALACAATGLLSGFFSLAVLATSLVIGFHLLLLAGLRAKLEFGPAAAALAGGRAVSFCVAVVAFTAADDSLPFLALGYFCGEVTTLLLAAAWLRPHWDAGGPAEEAGRDATITLRAAAPLAVNSFLILAYNRLDVVIAAVFLSPIQLGFYAIASRMQDALAVIPHAISTALLPIISATGAGPRFVRECLGEALVLGLVVALPALVLVQLTAPQIVAMVFSAGAYPAAATPMRILAVSLVFMVLAAPFLTGLFARDHAPATTIVYGAAFATALLLLPLFALRWGATGAAIATLCRDPVAVLLSIGLARRFGLTPAFAVPQVRWPIGLSRSPALPPELPGGRR